MLAIHGAGEAIEFYQRAFGAIELFRLTDAGGKVVHAEMKIGDGLFMLAEEHVDYNASPHKLGDSTVVLHIEVADAEAVFDRAIAAGAKVIFTLRDQFYGERSGRRGRSLRPPLADFPAYRGRFARRNATPLYDNHQRLGGLAVRTEPPGSCAKFGCHRRAKSARG